MLNTQSDSYRYTQCKCYQVEDGSSHLDENKSPSGLLFHKTTRMLMRCVGCRDGLNQKRPRGVPTFVPEKWSSQCVSLHFAQRLAHLPFAFKIEILAAISPLPCILYLLRMEVPHPGKSIPTPPSVTLKICQHFPPVLWNWNFGSNSPAASYFTSFKDGSLDLGRFHQG